MARKKSSGFDQSLLLNENSPLISHKRNWLIRYVWLIFGACVSLAVVIQMELANCLEQPDRCEWTGIKHGYSNPYFLVCWNQTMSVVIFPFLFFQAARSSSSNAGTSSPSSTSSQSAIGFFSSEWRANNLTWSGVFVFSILLAIIRKGDYLRFVALYGTTVDTGVAIYCCFPALVYVLDILFLSEPFDVWKMLAVSGCLLGVFIYSYPSLKSGKASGDGKELSNELGCIISFASAFLFAIYQVLYKLVFKKRRAVDSLLLVNMLSALIGLSSLIFCYPFVVLLNYVPVTWVIWEPITFPKQPAAIILLIIIGLLGVFINVGYQIMIKVLPVHVAASMWLLVIPFSLLADWILYVDVPNGYELVGAIVLLVSLHWVQSLQAVDKGQHQSG